MSFILGILGTIAAGAFALFVIGLVLAALSDILQTFMVFIIGFLPIAMMVGFYESLENYHVGMQQLWDVLALCGAYLVFVVVGVIVRGIQSALNDYEVGLGDLMTDSGPGSAILMFAPVIVLILRMSKYGAYEGAADPAFWFFIKTAFLCTIFSSLGCILFYIQLKKSVSPKDYFALKNTTRRGPEGYWDRDGKFHVYDWASYDDSD